MRSNDSLKFVISDVDETIAGVYMKAEKKMIKHLNCLLNKNVALFMISGQSFDNIFNRVICDIEPEYRKRIIIGTCSGSEVWGFNDIGEKNKNPYYSLLNEKLDDKQSKKWRKIIKEIINIFDLKVYDVMPKEKFVQLTKGNTRTIMLEDRNSQITFEVVNGINLDRDYINGQTLRDRIIIKANELLKEARINVKAQKAGNFAIDFIINGASKTKAVEFIMKNNIILSNLGFDNIDDNWIIKHMEVWGDKFSLTNGGTDMNILYALPKEVKAIDFRRELKDELDKNYNINIWKGKHCLDKGLLEYLERRCQFEHFK